MSLVFPIVLFVLIFYFLIFRPQKKKQQQHEQMVSSIGRGDTVITAGGFFGKVSDIMEDSYIIELADGVKVRILKSSISLKRDAAAADGRPKPDRPRKKRRRRPVEEGEANASTDETASEAAAESPEEGVTVEESEALLQGEASASSDEAATEEKKNDE